MSRSAGRTHRRYSIDSKRKGRGAGANSADRPTLDQCRRDGRGRQAVASISKASTSPCAGRDSISGGAAAVVHRLAAAIEVPTSKFRSADRRCRDPEPMTSSSGTFVGVGNFPLVEFGRIVPEGSARVVAKVESANPTGRHEGRWRDRVEGAIRDEHLKPAAPVLVHRRNHRISLAFDLLAALGYSLHIVFRRLQRRERRTMMAFGAIVSEDVPRARAVGSPSP